ncbi:COG3497 Phage tail sheath protein FI [uncultured Caudovirales phage]|uniref:COG3497 Phage tail sheath protein FI n=1 Tax=uncultured Caudovirales phage TaxID=2100421 RepID=A0A6J5LTU9_9CAUD|nr:COG3497 Phage tail sheath protein FI [uncultured Caudovirales phage]CAB4148132.1 COG3497 Phage tail sheath protein FI [uncultured Caudovirales phage]
MTYGRPGVYVNETLIPAPIEAAGSANAAGAAIGAFPQGPSTVTLVTSWFDFVQKFGGYSPTYPATFGVNQFFANGGSELYVRRVLGSGAAVSTVTIPTSTTGNLGTASSLNKGADSNNLRLQITGTATANYYNITVLKEVTTSLLGSANVNGTNDVIVEQFTNVVFNSASSSDYAETVVNATSQYITLDLTATGVPATQAISAVLPFTGGSDGSAPAYTDYTAVVATDGTSELDAIDRPLVIFAPNIHEKFVVDGNASAAAHLALVHDALIAWANSGSGFAIIDTAPSLTVAQAIAYITARTASSRAAGYYPHFFVQDPTARSAQALRKTAPAGAVAGIYLATDKTDGPFKSPAGTSANIRTAISLERAFTPADLDSLNSGIYTSGSSTVYGTSVNAIRNLPGAGVVIMGARTLLQDGTANKYVSTRRSLIYITKQLENLTQYAVFRNNDPKLWSQLRTTISVFLNEYSNQGGLRGNSPAEAYYVKVDSSINTPASIATGVVNIQVGVALEYPAEFVVINLSQITGN